MTRSSAARSTASTPRRQVARGAQSLTAWERVLDRLRTKLPGKPSRSAVFGRADLRSGKMFWMRRHPDLRASVIVKLSKPLGVSPGDLLDMMVREAKKDPLGGIRF